MMMMIQQGDWEAHVMDITIETVVMDHFCHEHKQLDKGHA